MFFKPARVNHHGDKMMTQAFKKRIYEVKFKTSFVLEPSNLIKNQRLVSYLNSIYNTMVEARTSNYLDEVLFLIATVPSSLADD